MPLTLYKTFAWQTFASLRLFTCLVLHAYCTFVSKQAVSITLFGPRPNNNWQEKLADEKSLELKKKEKEEGAGREEHRQSAVELLGQTVKKHFGHSDHSHFLCLRGKLVVHSKRALDSRIFPPWTTFSTQSFQGAVRRRRLFRRRCVRSLTRHVYASLDKKVNVVNHINWNYKPYYPRLRNYRKPKTRRSRRLARD